MEGPYAPYWSAPVRFMASRGTCYDGHCRAVRIGLFGSRYSEISTVPTLLNRLAAMSFGTTWLNGGSGRLMSAQRTENQTSRNRSTRRPGCE